MFWSKVRPWHPLPSFNPILRKVAEVCDVWNFWFSDKKSSEETFQRSAGHLFLNKRFISSWLENLKGKNKFWDFFFLVSMQWPNFDAQTHIIVEAEFGILRTIKSKQKHSRRGFFFNQVKKSYFYRRKQFLKVSLKVNLPKNQFVLIKYHFYTINGRTLEHGDISI